MSANHLSEAFERDLTAIRNQTLSLMRAVDEQMQGVLKALSQPSAAQTEAVVQGDVLINDQQTQLDATIEVMMSLRHPLADDLRQLIGALRVSSDLERVGDELRNIARSLGNLDQAKITDFWRQVLSIAMKGIMLESQMLKDLEKAYVSNDANLAMAVKGHDRAIDEIYGELRHTIVELMPNFLSQCPTQLEHMMDLMRMARAVERVGDHLTNVAEAICYIRSGEDVRHADSQSKCINE